MTSPNVINARAPSAPLPSCAPDWTDGRAEGRKYIQTDGRTKNCVNAIYTPFVLVIMKTNFNSLSYTICS